ncbi:MAG TPA: hypothetical protein V6C98_12480 [Thermosynechococcaceae cyanobacterium]
MAPSYLEQWQLTFSTQHTLWLFRLAAQLEILSRRTGGKVGYGRTIATVTSYRSGLLPYAAGSGRS